MSKGYLFFQRGESFERARRDNQIDEFFADEAAAKRGSYGGQGWYAISEAIMVGDIIKVSAARDSITVEARFNSSTNVPNGDNGFYQVGDGPCKSTGTFLKVIRKPREDLDFKATDNAKFTNFFAGDSHATGNGVPYLRWRIALCDLVAIPD